MAWIIRKNFQNSINDLDLYNTTKHILADNIPSQTDITRLREGHVGGQVNLTYLFLYLIK